MQVLMQCAANGDFTLTRGPPSIVLRAIELEQVERNQDRVAFSSCPWRSRSNMASPFSSQATTSPSIRQDLAGRCEHPDAGRISTGH